MTKVYVQFDTDSMNVLKELVAELKEIRLAIESINNFEEVTTIDYMGVSKEKQK